VAKGGDSTTTTTSDPLSQAALPYYTDAMAKAKTATSQTYTPYQGQRLADFSGDTNASFNMIRNQAAAGTPGADAAMATAGGVAGYQAKGIPEMDFAAYANPFTENVLDVQKRRLNQSFEEQQASRDASAVAAGAFGGDRRFVQDSLARRDMNDQLQGIEATGLRDMFDRATGLFQADEENRRLGSTLGLEGARTQGQLAQLKNDLGLQNAEALSGVGAKQQQRTQAGLDLAYKDFVSQRDYPQQQAALYAQLLSGVPTTPQTSATTTEAPPDFLSQLLGLAVGGAGVYDLLN
jgi:hypothetical protein